MEEEEEEGDGEVESAMTDTGRDGVRALPRRCGRLSEVVSDVREDSHSAPPAHPRKGKERTKGKKKEERRVRERQLTVKH